MTDASAGDVYDFNEGKHKMYHEFCTFEEIIRNRDYKKAEEMLAISEITMEIQTEARKKAGIVFKADKKGEA